MQRHPAVLVQGLEKTYPGGTRAIDGIDFTVDQGEFFGFLGPNGAGKTTTIKILATLLSKSAGRVEVAGIDIDQDARAVRSAIGVRFEGGALGILAVIAAATLLGVAMGCVGLIVAVRTRSVQVTVNSWLLFMPLAFLTSAFMPRDLLTGWFQFAVGLNPVEYILVAVRTIIIDGWIWEHIVPGFWVLLATSAVLIAAATYEYRRATN